MPKIAVGLPELQGAAWTLQRAGSELSNIGVRSLDGTGDLGTPELEQAVLEVSESSLAVVMTLWNALIRTSQNLYASYAAYQRVDSRTMRVR